MPRRIRVLAPLALVAALAGLSGGAARGDAPTDPGRDFGLSHRPVCPPAAPHAARCHADVVTGAAGEPHATSSFTNGYQPSDLVDAYNLPSGAGRGQTVAIVDAYDNPNAETDLGVYRARFGLRPCTTDNGCFRKLDQRGGTGYPRGDAGWGQEIALDLDMVSAVCPLCDIMLVAADSSSFADLAAGVDMAASKGVSVISNSYGAPEFRGEASWEGHYNHPGVAITVSSGDSGYGVEFPAASQYVTAVGGTRLSRVSAGGEWAETVWSGAGSGCSAYVSKPAWQGDRLTCPRRTVADVAAVADPATGVAVYNSYGATGGAYWSVFGGTSVAAPVIAGVYALAGNSATVISGSYAYAHAPTGALFDVTSGSNGRCSNRRTASLAYLCTGGLGYDGPTGVGTPNGAAAF
jgi:subtilase family serine protease